jgi:hypothetical protein
MFSRLFIFSASKETAIFFKHGCKKSSRKRLAAFENQGVPSLLFVGFLSEKPYKSYFGMTVFKSGVIPPKRESFLTTTNI